jgi:hypothetical protein
VRRATLSADGEHVEAAHARGEQRLMRVAHRGVGDEQAFLLAIQSLQNFSGPISVRSCFVPLAGSMR